MRQPDEEPSQQIIRHEIVRDSANGRTYDRVIQTLIPLGIVAIIGTLWFQSVASARQTVVFQSQTEEIEELKTAVRELANEVREMREERAARIPQ